MLAAGAQPFAPTQEPGSGWQLPPLKGSDFLLIAINILLFPQGFCKKRAGSKTLSVFLLSHSLPWKEVVGSPWELVQVLGYP